MTGIDFLDDIHHCNDFTIFSREFYKTKVNKDVRYFGRLFRKFSYPHPDEKFTSWEYTSTEKGTLFDIVFVIRLYVSDSDRSRKGMDITGELGKGKIRRDIGDELLDNIYFKHAEFVNEIIKDLRGRLINAAAEEMYDLDRSIMRSIVLEDMYRNE